MKKLGVSLLVSALALSACTKTEKVIERLPPEKVAESFDVSEKSALVLKKAALDKAFMMMATSKKMTTTPEWEDHVARVVSFEKYGNRVGLYELGEKHVYENIPVTHLIQSFKILKETDSEIYIDLGKGFKSLDVADNLEVLWPSTDDFSMASAGAKPKLEVIEGVVRSKSLENNRLKIVQDSRVRENKLAKAPESAPGVSIVQEQGIKNYEYNLQTHFEFIPYTENKNFQTKELDLTFRIGLFSLRTIKPGSTDEARLALRWDTSDSQPPIRFILSKDVPGAYVEDIEKGLKYWNRVFGKTVLTVEQSDQSDLLPQDRAVLVRWVDWPTAGFAYAGFQANPITGEILRGQIFLPSFWSTIPEEGANQAGLQDIPGEVSTREKLRRLELMMTVAHEAGHVFGMRHNFAASASKPVSVSLVARLKSLFKQGRTSESAETSTSVMDYQFGLDGALVAKFIEQNTLAYDRDVIQWGYQGKENPDTLPGEFCTDEHLMLARKFEGSVLGCAQGDSAGNPILAGFYSLKENFIEASLKNTVRSLLFQIYAKGSERTSLKPAAYTYHAEVGLSGPIADILFEKKYTTEGTTKALFSIEALSQKILSDLRFPGDSAPSDGFLASKISALVDTAKADPNVQDIILFMDGANGSDLSWIAEASEEVLKDPALSTVEVGGKKYSMTEQDREEIRAVLEYRAPEIKKAFLLGYAASILPGEKMTEYNSKLKKNVEYSTIYRNGVSGLNLEKAGVVALSLGLLSHSTPTVVGHLLGSPFLASRTPVSKAEMDKWLPVLKKYLGPEPQIVGQLKTLLREPLSRVAVSLGGKAEMSSAEISSLVSSAYGQGKVDMDLFMWVASQVSSLGALEGLNSGAILQ